MRIAILDLGTNTFHCLIVNVTKEMDIVRLFKSKSVVKLGEGIHQGMIAPAAFQRGVKAIVHYRSIIDKYRPEKIFAFATSATRSAKNGEEFVKEIKEKTGIDINVISGDREAELICHGVRGCVELSDAAELIMDIGGGSTEFILASNEKIFWKHSFDLGASRLLQMFNPSDPMKDYEIDLLTGHFEKILEPLFVLCKKHQPGRLIGSSGSFDTLAEMIGYRFHRRNVIKDRKSYDFDIEEYYKLHHILLPSTILQRRKMKGLIKLRVDMIVVASLLTHFVLQRTGIEKMTLSKFALKEGALFEVIRGNIN